MRAFACMPEQEIAAVTAEYGLNRVLVYTWDGRQFVCVGQSAF